MIKNFPQSKYYLILTIVAQCAFWSWVPLFFLISPLPVFFNDYINYLVQPAFYLVSLLMLVGIILLFTSSEKKLFIILGLTLNSIVSLIVIGFVWYQLASYNEFLNREAQLNHPVVPTQITLQP